MSRGRRGCCRPGCGKRRGRFAGNPAWSPDAATGPQAAARVRGRTAFAAFRRRKAGIRVVGGRFPFMGPSADEKVAGVCRLFETERTVSDYVTRAKKQLVARVRKASGTVCWQTRMVARRRGRAAGSRPRDGSERLLLLFAAEKQKKTDDAFRKRIWSVVGLCWGTDVAFAAFRRRKAEENR